MYIRNAISPHYSDDILRDDIRHLAIQEFVPSDISLARKIDKINRSLLSIIVITCVLSTYKFVHIS